MGNSVVDKVYADVCGQCCEGDREIPQGDNRVLPTIPRDPADVLRRVEAAGSGMSMLNPLYPIAAVKDTVTDPFGKRDKEVATRVLKKIDEATNAFNAVDKNLRPVVKMFAFPDPDGKNPNAAKAVWKPDQRPKEITALPETTQLIHALKSKLDGLADDSLTQVYNSGKAKEDTYVQQLWTGGRQNTAKALQSSPVDALCAALTGCKSAGGSPQPINILGGGKDKPAETTTPGTSARDAINGLWKALTDKSDKAREVLVSGGDPLRDKVLTEEVTNAAKSTLSAADASLGTAVSKAKSWNLALESAEVSEVVTPKPNTPTTPKPSTPGTPTPGTPATPKPEDKKNDDKDNKGSKPLTAEDIKRMMEQQNPTKNTPTNTPSPTGGGGIQTPNLGGLGSGGSGPQAAKPASTNPSEGQGPKKVEPNKDTSDDEAKKRAEEAEKKRKEDEAKRKSEEEERKKKEEEEKKKKEEEAAKKKAEEEAKKGGEPKPTPAPTPTPAGTPGGEKDKPAPGAAQPPQQGQPGVPNAPQDSKPDNTVKIGNKDVTYPSGKTAALGELLSRGTPEHPASFSNAAAQSGINLPPAGELVGQPVSPQQAQVGDAAVDKDGKMYQVIGDGKVVGEDGKTHNFADLKFGETGTGFFKLDGTAGDAPQGAVPPQGDAGQTPKDGPAQQGGQPGSPAPGGAPAPGTPGVPNAPADGAGGGAGGQGGAGAQPGAPAGASPQPGAGIPQPSGSPTPDDGSKPGGKPDGAGATPAPGAPPAGGGASTSGDPTLPQTGKPDDGTRPPTALGSGVQHDQTVLNPKAVPSGN